MTRCLRDYSASDLHAPALRHSLKLGNLIVYGITIQLTATTGIYGVLSSNTRGHVVSSFFLAMVVRFFTAVSYGPTTGVYSCAGFADVPSSTPIHPTFAAQEIRLTQPRTLPLSRRLLLLPSFALALAAVAQAPHPATQRDPDHRAWMRRVRIGAWSLTPDNAKTIVQQAADSGVFGIEVDNDIPGRYDSLLHPEAKLEAIRKVSLAAHQHGNKTFVYIAGLECISADDSSPHTVAKEHPDWLQRKRSGEPAIFGNKAAFWIAKGEEDTWISPFAADWRKLYMERVRQIAGTGVDGLYVDIPYWMTHFTGWEDTWASFDDATVAAFRQQTGLDARKDIKLGDFNDPGFLKWVDFRIKTLTDFLAEIRKVATAVNPNIALIPEIYPGIESEAARVGADVYQMYTVSDAIAHEYEFGGGDDHTAAMRPPFDWLMYQIGMRSFRAFAGDKPTWILNYSWDGAPHVKAADAMQTLFMSELMAGANVWDASGHVMSGSNDLAERRTIYHWIAAHDDLFGVLRQPIGDVGVYFSDTTRNQHPDEFIASYRGALLLLLQAHRQFRIVTPRTLSSFHGTTLVLPAVHTLDTDERQTLEHFATGGGKVVLTGFASPDLSGLPHAVRLPDNPGRTYLTAAEKDLAAGDQQSQAAFLNALGPAPTAEPQLFASPEVVAHAATINGRTVLFLANFTGIKPGEQLTPAPQADVHISVPASLGTKARLLPFLGTEITLYGVRSGDRITFTLPSLERGAVLSFQ